MPLTVHQSICQSVLNLSVVECTGTDITVRYHIYSLSKFGVCTGTDITYRNSIYSTVLNLGHVQGQTLQIGILSPTLLGGALEVSSSKPTEYIVMLFLVPSV